MKKVSVKKVPVAKVKTPGARKPQASRPHFKRAKLSVLGRSAYPQGKPAFPATLASALGGPAMGGGDGAMGGGDMGGGAPMPPNAEPDNVGGGM